MYTWALHRRLSNEAVHNPDSPSPKSLPKPAGKSRGGVVRAVPLSSKCRIQEADLCHGTPAIVLVEVRRFGCRCNRPDGAKRSASTRACQLI